MPEKILIIHSGGIGDLLLALPAMRIFRQAFPHSTLDLLGRPERLALVFHDLGASSVHSIDQAGMAYFYVEGASFPPSLSTFFSSFRAALVFRKMEGRILAENLKKVGIDRVISIPSVPPEDLRIHASDYLVEVLKDEGIPGENLFVPLALPDEAMSFGKSFWDGHGLGKEEKVLAIHPGSGSPAKNWDSKNFAEVADWASEQSRILLISGPADEGVQEVIEAIRKARPIFAHHLTLLQLAGVLKSCTTYLGNDSGITHLAASLGIPTVAIFSSTDPAIWGPRGLLVKIIYRKYSGLPYWDLPKKGRPFACSQNVQPEEVIEVLGSSLWG